MIWRISTVSALALMALSLAACAALRSEGQQPTPAVTLALQPGGIIETAEADAASGTPTPTSVPDPAGHPVLVTHESTDVRLGPGTTYGISYVIDGDSTVVIVGRNLDGTWWAIQGLGDGSGPPGWVLSAEVTVQGDAGEVPILAAPTLTPTSGTTSLTLMGNVGTPPGGDACVVVHPGPNDPGPAVVRLGPGNEFAVNAQLAVNRWAPITEAQSGWYRIQDSGGISGWVHQSEVAFSGRCSGPGSGPDLPLVENPGAPPSDLCLASRPGQFPPPGIHVGPGRQFILAARLGNWAEILSAEVGWYQIAIGPGQVGWVSGQDVELIGSCSTPRRIQFQPGAISASVSGELQPPLRDRYLFRAMAGQRTIIEIHSTGERANFMLNGVTDGQPYKRLEDELRTWSATLPRTQDYLLTVAAPADAPLTPYSLDLTIEPLDSQPTPSIGMEIDHFAVSAVDLPNNGKRLTFEWETSGGASARILSGTQQRFQTVWDLPLSGEMTVDVSQTLFRDPAMTLELRNAAGVFIGESIVVPWQCTSDYFFEPAPRRCPLPAESPGAAIQPFEMGWMVWLEQAFADGRPMILVLYQDGTLQLFNDSWQEGDQIDDPKIVPPAGLFQPARGVGLVWREQSGVRDRLGWATGGEQAFQATLQLEIAESISSTGYLELPDGRIIHLPLSGPTGSWEQIN